MSIIIDYLTLIVDIYEKARQSSVIQMNKDELIKLCLAYCAWERRRYVLMPSGKLLLLLLIMMYSD
jgi:hypothetical protein